MKRIRIMGLAIVAVFALSAVVAGAAQAEGPSWINSGGKLTANKKIKSVNVSSLKLTGAAPITCTGETNTGELIAHDPGEDTATVTFTGCTGAENTGCTTTGAGEFAVKNAKEETIAGEIQIKVLTGLMYPKGSAKGTAEALDGFFPAKSSNLFAEVTFANVTACGTLKGKTIKVSATGTAVHLNQLATGETRKCGVLAQVGKISGGAFVVTKAGETAIEGGLNFPSTAIAAGEWEEGTAFKEVKCSLEADGAAAGEVGVVKVETEPTAEAFGWTNS